MSEDTVGSRIRIKREEKKWTQDKLAQTAKISKGFLSDVENDKRSISAENLLRIANALGASLEFLLRGFVPKEEELPAKIPVELAKAAEELNLTYTETVSLARTGQSIVARRGGKPRKMLSMEDWKRLHATLKAFY
jgi:transcriptional regulator with XRE-family HTH domain